MLAWPGVLGFAFDGSAAVQAYFTQYIMPSLRDLNNDRVINVRVALARTMEVAQRLLSATPAEVAVPDTPQSAASKDTSRSDDSPVASGERRRSHGLIELPPVAVVREAHQAATLSSTNKSQQSERAQQFRLEREMDRLIHHSPSGKRSPQAAAIDPAVRSRLRAPHRISGHADARRAQTDGRDPIAAALTGGGQAAAAAGASPSAGATPREADVQSMELPHPDTAAPVADEADADAAEAPVDADADPEADADGAAPEGAAEPEVLVVRSPLPIGGELKVGGAGPCTRGAGI